MKKTIIYSNAGHGGINPKTGEYTTPAINGKRTLHTNGKEYHNKGWFYEGVVNRQLAAIFNAKATEAGYTVITVYDAIEDTGLDVRVKLANDHKEKYDCHALWISFHANAANVTGTARGFNVFHFPGNLTTKELAVKIGLPVNKYFNAKGSLNNEYVREGWGWRNGTKFALYELEKTKMPALLFEWGFFDNDADADLLMMPEFREDSVSFLVDELVKWVK